MKKAYLYARTSTTRQQKADRQSVDSQLEQGKTFLKQHPEYELQGFIIDAASAYSGNHLEDDAGLGNFLKEAEQGMHVDSLLVVVYTDRLTRMDIDDAFHLLKRLALAKVNLAITSQGQFIHHSAPLDFGLRMMLTTLFYTANNESSTKSHRVRAAFKERARKIASGEKVLKTKGLPLWIDIVNGEYYLDPVKAKAIQYIFEQKLKGHGAWVIARKLQEGGFVPFSPKGWSRSYIHNLLKNPSTYGAYQVYVTSKEASPTTGKNIIVSKPQGEPILDYYPAAITKTIFDSAQFSRTLARSGRTSDKSPFKGLLRCYECGRGMSLCTSGGGGGRNLYLRCNDSKEPLVNRTCNALSIRLDVAKERIMKAISQIKLPHLMSKRPEESAIKSQIAELGTSIDRYHRLLTSTTIESIVDDAIEKITQFTIQKEELERELLKLSISAPDLSAYDIEKNPREFNQAMLAVFEYIGVNRRYMSFQFRGTYGNEWDPAIIDWNADSDRSIQEFLLFLQQCSTD